MYKNIYSLHIKEKFTDIEYVLYKWAPNIFLMPSIWISIDLSIND